ncbi:caspase-10 isoform X1 [Otolemur garnettii]|uniref:caspase-10 isoform X1 n=1 Tax=Otolemur garnettii TaxID=30611 RepID=UPI000273FE9D|nr:caspase-10 isoform X1 [Otolemur garnettii]
MATASQGQCLGSSSDTNCLVDFRERLLTIDSNLGVKDVEHLKFLCQGFVSLKKLEKSSSASDIFEQLLAQELLSEEDPFFLAELLYIIRQKSLLKHLGYTKEQVMDLLPSGRKISPFRELLYQLSQEIDTETLKNIIFLLGDSIPKTPMTSLNLLDYLEKQGKIAEDDLTLLENLFKTVAPKLIKMLETYKGERAAQLVTPPVDTETESLHQGEQELLSGSDTKKLLEALPETAVYSMNRKYRGHCVIVNNHKFTDRPGTDNDALKDRPGTDKDAECLTQVFEWLGFTVCQYDNVTKEVMDQVLQEQKRDPDHDDRDCFVFCVLTHGDLGAVYSSDGVLIPIRKITSHFTAEQCPGLREKPKLFFFQACQGVMTQSSVAIEADAWNPEHTLKQSIPKEADFLLGMATVPGCKCFRDVEKGSWYIQSLCNCLKKLVPRGEDILSILTVVNHDVSRQTDEWGTKKQMPQPAFTLTKKLVFPVPQGAFQG